MGIRWVSTGAPFAEPCGSSVNAVRYAQGTVGLRAGKHLFRMETLETMSPFNPRLMWEGPTMHLSDVPESAFSHLRTTKTGTKPAGQKHGAGSSFEWGAVRIFGRCSAPCMTGR